MLIAEHAVDALDTMIEGFRENLEYGYTDEDLSLYVSAILVLAKLKHELVFDYHADDEFAERHGAYKSWRLSAECYVVEQLTTDDEHGTLSPTAVDVVAKIAAINPALRTAIKRAYKWRCSKAGISEALSHDNPVSYRAIYDRISSL